MYAKTFQSTISIPLHLALCTAADGRYDAMSHYYLNDLR
jgi:hypothetical protein